MDDSELLGRICSGDDGALADLYDRYAPAAIALAIRIRHDQGEAEDVVQEVFLRIWREAHRYDARLGSVPAWIFGAIRHAAIDRLRRGAAFRRARRRILPPEGPAEIGPEERERILAALGALARPQREVLELAYFDGLTQREIASKLGLPLGTVKTRTRIALRTLRETVKIPGLWPVFHSLTAVPGCRFRVSIASRSADLSERHKRTAHGDCAPT